MTRITIDLPPVTPPSKPASAPPVFITVATDGRLSIEGRPTTLEALPADLSARLGDGPKDEQRIMIHAGQDVPFDRFMALLNSLQEHGWYKVGLVDKDPPLPKP